ncbi:hypothetical protein D9758_002868 [Tetrapyrgos nigripes]|uniref:C2H2-type domain-containing protein n=1 Tax=Tetrapyrgos nigripes TaxID=182062 RepID=A0A8H5GQH1_9AGAR|nr:hypothetical protein D9758_002868 [Tetrapyrgos nigripes]
MAPTRLRKASVATTGTNDTAKITGRKKTLPPRKTTTKASVKREFVAKEKQKNFCCMHCQKCFERRWDLGRHMKTHDPEAKKFRCPGCTHETLQLPNMEEHIRTKHIGIKDHCPHPKCPFTSGHPSSMLRHRKDLHGYIPGTEPREPRIREAAATTSGLDEYELVPFVRALASSPGSPALSPSPPFQADEEDDYPHPDILSGPLYHYFPQNSSPSDTSSSSGWESDYSGQHVDPDYNAAGGWQDSGAAASTPGMTVVSGSAPASKPSGPSTPVDKLEHHINNVLVTTDGGQWSDYGHGVGTAPIANHDGQVNDYFALNGYPSDSSSSSGWESYSGQYVDSDFNAAAGWQNSGTAVTLSTPIAMPTTTSRSVTLSPTSSPEPSGPSTPVDELGHQFNRFLVTTGGGEWVDYGHDVDTAPSDHDGQVNGGCFAVNGSPDLLPYDYDVGSAPIDDGQVNKYFAVNGSSELMSSSSSSSFDTWGPSFTGQEICHDHFAQQQSQFFACHTGAPSLPQSAYGML